MKNPIRACLRGLGRWVVPSAGRRLRATERLQPADRRLPVVVQWLAGGFAAPEPRAVAYADDTADDTAHPRLPSARPAGHGPVLDLSAWPRHADLPVLCGHFDLRPYAAVLGGPRVAEPGGGA